LFELLEFSIVYDKYKLPLPGNSWTFNAISCFLQRPVGCKSRLCISNQLKLFIICFVPFYPSVTRKRRWRCMLDESAQA